MRSEEFERWFSIRNDLDMQVVSEMWNGETYKSFRFTVETAWRAWNASREAVMREAIQNVKGSK